MPASHQHDHAHGHGGESRRLAVAFFLNLTFTLIEIAGGLLTNSIAILSDALHDLGDTISLGLAWGLGRYAEKGQDVRYSYGYRRYSLLGALLNSIVLIGGSVFVLTEAVPRLLEPQRPNASIMAVLALVGIAVNGAAALNLKGGRSLNTQTVTWHLLEDVLGWAAVLLVSIVLLFADLPILDPLLAIGITLFVLYNVFGKLRQTAALFLQATPEDVDVAELEAQIRAVAGVADTHHTHVWSLDGEHHVISTHVVVADATTRADVLRIKQRVKEVLDDETLEHLTIEVEYADEDCSMTEVNRHEQ